MKRSDGVESTDSVSSNEEMMTTMPTPSAHQIGQKVNLNFFKSGMIKNAEITAVKFHRGKVYYDVAIELTDGDHHTIISDVDNVCVEASTTPQP